jgi:hypothetical protein
LGVKVLPVANHYSGYYNFRERVTLSVGEPVNLSDYFERYREHPEKAQLELARDMHQKVNDLVLNIKSKDDYNKINFLRITYLSKHLKTLKLRSSYFPNHLKASHDIVACLETAQENSPEVVAPLLNNAQEMIDGLQKLNLRVWLFESNKNFILLLLNTVFTAILLPIYVLCYALNFVPFKLTGHLVRNVKDPQLYSSFVYVLGGLVLFPLYYLAAAFSTVAITNSWYCGLTSAVLLPLTTLFFWWYKKGLIKLRGRWRFRKLEQRQNSLFLRMRDLYQTIIADMNNIVKQVKVKG